MNDTHAGKNGLKNFSHDLRFWLSKPSASKLAQVRRWRTAEPKRWRSLMCLGAALQLVADSIQKPALKPAPMPPQVRARLLASLKQKREGMA